MPPRKWKERPKKTTTRAYRKSNDQLKARVGRATCVKPGCSRWLFIEACLPMFCASSTCRVCIVTYTSDRDKQFWSMRYIHNLSLSSETDKVSPADSLESAHRQAVRRRRSLLPTLGSRPDQIFSVRSVPASGKSAPTPDR